MGVDLRLLPFDGEHFSHTVLNCTESSDLFSLIDDLPARSVPEPFHTFCSRDNNADSHYGDTQETVYGETLRYTRVAHLLPLAEHPHVLDDYINRAVWAYLKCLPPQTKVALYWH